MTATWMAYALSLSFCFALAALLLERVANVWLKPRRLIWAVAILACLLVPVVGLVVGPARAPESSAAAAALALPPRPVLAVAPVTGPSVGTGSVWASKLDPALRSLNQPLLLCWGGVSLLLALGLFRARVRLRRRARTWRAAFVDGQPVLAAPNLGPAVVRLDGLRIVLPDWALSAEPAARSLMLLHEQEHCRARDPDLLLGATVALVLVPWNVALWWQVHRLRLAVETDCDRRVLRAGGDPHTYGVLLLSVGARVAPEAQLTATAFSEAPSLLEGRIEAMTSPRPRNPILQVAAATGIAALILVAAAMMPQPAGAGARQPTAAAQGQDTAGFDVTLKVRSTVPGQEIRFKAAYDMGDRSGLRFVDTTTPFQVTGRTHDGATAMLEKLGGGPELDAALVRGTGADTLRVAQASGPRLVVRYRPPPSTCVGRQPLSVEYLRELTRRYHPQALAPAAQRDSVIVGFVFDATCQVVRHAIGRYAGDTSSSVDGQLARLFPAVSTRDLNSAGGYSREPFTPGHLSIVWGILKRR